MKIFVLEDNQERMAYFAKTFIEHELVLTNSVEQARKILENEKFNLLMLDHDLSGQVFVASEDRNTGHYLCKHMNETKNSDVSIIIHSWNQDGAKNMMETLVNNGHTGKVEYLMYLTEEFEIKIKQLLSQVEQVKEVKSDVAKTSYELVVEKYK